MELGAVAHALLLQGLCQHLGRLVVRKNQLMRLFVKDGDGFLRVLQHIAQLLVLLTDVHSVQCLAANH